MESVIKLFVMDVDGTMTDGRIYMGHTGELFKSFDIKDGYGIHEILPEHGVKSAIITGRKSDIVVNRARELEIDYVMQGIKNKEKAVLELSKELKLKKEEIAYIGDDMIDVPAMLLCGICGCPWDAVNEVKEVCDFVASKNGGEGAVREFIEYLDKRKKLGDKRCI